MDILIFIIALLFTVARTTATKFYNKTQGNVFVFNLIVSIFALIPPLIYVFFGANFNLATILFGIVYGFLLAASMISGFFALKYGPMALTGMLSAFSVVIPLTFGLFVGETLSIFGAIGLVSLLGSIDRKSVV